MRSEMALTPKAPVIPQSSRAGKYLMFNLGKEFFGIRVIEVKEIMGLPEITAIPHAPSFMKGVFNLRGKVIPVIDLRARFVMEEIPYHERTCTIVVSVATELGLLPMGLIVDGVAEVVFVNDSDVEDTPALGADVDTAYLLGIAKIRNEVRMLLDMNRVLNIDQIAAMKSMSAAPSDI